MKKTIKKLILQEYLQLTKIFKWILNYLVFGFVSSENIKKIWKIYLDITSSKS